MDGWRDRTGGEIRKRNKKDIGEEKNVIEKMEK